MRYGKITETHPKGNNGLETIEQVYCDEQLYITRKRYEERERVKNQTEELEAYLKFSDELLRDKKMLDPEWRIERNVRGGGYDVVKCYTRLEHMKKKC